MVHQPRLMHLDAPRLTNKRKVDAPRVHQLIDAPRAEEIAIRILTLFNATPQFGQFWSIFRRNDMEFKGFHFQ